MIKLYGAEKCHKTQHYKAFFFARTIGFTFLDVEKNEENAKELRNLYESGRLNFPTITINHKKLRNPSDKELEKQCKRS
jgi:arsenate reductase-like glutaredoxin family protein